jgi:hypothetical protein
MWWKKDDMQRLSTFAADTHSASTFAAGIVRNMPIARDFQQNYFSLRDAAFKSANNHEEHRASSTQ